MQLAYNHEAVQAAQPVNGKLTEYRIDGVPGLVLRVMPSGFASWWLYYRKRVGKVWRLRKLKLGERSKVSLSAVAKHAKELHPKIAADADPVADKLSERSAVTFRELAERRLEKDNRISQSTRKLYSELLQGKVYAALGDIPACKVTTDVVAQVLNKISADRQADIAKAAISSTFRWGIKRNEVRHNPVTGLGQRAPTGVRKIILSDDQIVTLWRATEANDIWLSRSMRLIFRLILLTGQRRNEVAGACKQELRLDVERPAWTIPGDAQIRGKVIEGRTKNGKEQVLPLSRQAAALFAEAVQLSPDPEYLFPSDAKSHIRGRSVSAAMRMLRQEKGIQEATVHDLRRSMATWMGEEGIRPDVIDLVLNHAPKAQDVTRRHYNFAKLEPVVRQALQAWADHVERLIGRMPIGNNIVALTAGVSNVR